MRKCLTAVLIACLTLIGCSGATIESTSSQQPNQEQETLLAASAQTNPNLSADAKRLIFAHVHQADENSSEIHSQALYIQRELAKVGIAVDIYPASALGGQIDINEAMRMGTIDMSICGTSTFSTIAPKLSICDFPYLWKNFDHISAAMDGEIGESLKSELDSSGLHILSFSRSWGFRNIGLFSGKATSYDELKGMKIRTIQSEISIGAMKSMNTTPTPLAMGEVYSALQTGVIDGFEHTAATTVMNKWNEVCKYFLLTEHQEPELCTVISLSKWNSFTTEEQVAIQKACDEAAMVCSSLAIEKDELYKQQLIEDSGTEVIAIDKTPFIQFAKSFNESHAKKIGAIELYNKIVQLGESY